MNFTSLIFRSLQRFSVRLLTFVFLLGLTFTASAAITVTIVTPLNAAKVDTIMPVTATMQATYEISSVTGTIAGKTIAFTFSQTAISNKYGGSPGWLASVDLTGVTRGTYQLVVTAVDAIGATASATRSVTLDAKPRVEVRKPVPYAVATPTIDLDVACVDDDAGCSLSVRANTSMYGSTGAEVLTGTGTAVGTVDLTAYIGQTVSLTVTATDSVGQIATKTLSVPVVDTARLALQANVPGRIFDVAVDRILYLDDTVEPQLLKIRNRATGADTTIYSVVGDRPATGYLYTGGAIFMENHGTSLNARVYDWRNGSIVDVAPASQWLWVNTNDFIVRGQYAMWSGRRLNDTTGNYEYYLRNLASGTDQLIATGVGNNTNSLTTGGVVAYWKSIPNGCSSCTYAYDYEVFLWKSGVSTQITHGGGLWSIYPTTDGLNVVIKRRANPGSTATQNNQIILWNGSQETVLADMGALDPNPSQNYAIANGYVAFTKPGTSGQLQVWRRLPSGTLEQLTFFSVGSQIDTISDTGTVTLTNGGKLYVYEVGGKLIELGAGLEKRFWLNSELYGVVGGSVFKIDRAATPSPVTTSTTSTTTTVASTTTTTQLVSTSAVLDQAVMNTSVLQSAGIYPTQWAAQTFTAAKTGNLDSISLILYGGGTSKGVTTVEIRNTAGNSQCSSTCIFPDYSANGLLGAVQVPASSVPSWPSTSDWTTLSLAGKNIQIVDGSKYAIVVSTVDSASNINWRNNNDPNGQLGDRYLGGVGLVSTGSNPAMATWTSLGTADFHFITYVIPNSTITTTTTTTTSTTTAGTTTTTVASTTTTTLPSSTTVIDLEQGWNLLGNGTDQPLTVATLFNDPLSVNTIWKWDVVTTSWQFYTPTLNSVDLQAYAVSKGYSVMTVVNPGDGYWVNAKLKTSLTVVAGVPFKLGVDHVETGWNLVATGDSVTPSAFNLSLVNPLVPPPAVGVVPINLTTLWTWDNPQSKWYFYAPNLDGQGGSALTDYIISKGYLDFTATNKKLGQGIGFWVKKQ